MISRSLLPLAATLAALAVGAAPASAAAPHRCDPSVAALQQRLAALHVPAGAADGCAGPATRAGVEAFQKANGLTPDAVVGPATKAALAHPAALVPSDRRPGRHVEVDLARQLLLVVDDGAVSALYTVSTGMRGHETPVGRFAIDRKERRSWSVPYRTWMPWASYFVGGVAFHEGDTETSRSSHGCVHVPAPFAAALYRLLTRGTTVVVR